MVIVLALIVQAPFVYDSTFYGETEGLDSPTVLAVNVDAKDRLWVGTYAGLSRFDGAEFTPIELPRVSRVRRIILGQRLWLPSFTDLRVRENDQWRIIGAIENVYDVLETDFGIWIASGTGLYFMESNQPELFSDERGMACARVYRLAAINRHQFWVATECGLIRFDGFGFSFPEIAEVIGQNNVYDVVVTAAGSWFATANGLFYLRSDGIWRHYNRRSGLPHDSVWTVFADRRGWVWAGTDGGLAVSFDGIQFNALSDSQVLGYTTIYAIAEDRGGSMWFGTCSGLIHVAEPRVQLPASDFLQTPVTGFLNHHELGPLVATQRGVYQDDHILIDEPYVRKMIESEDGTIWLAGRQGLLHWSQDRSQRYGRDDGLESEHLLHISELGPTRFLLSTLEGVFLFDGNRADRPPGFSTKVRVFASLQSASGTTYFATESGLYQTPNLITTAAQRVGPALEVFALTETANGVLAGTSTGLFRVRSDSLIRESDPSYPVVALTSDTLGRVWIGGKKGLEVWNGSYRKRVWPFRGELEPNFNAMLKTGDRIYMGHYRGYIQVQTQPPIHAQTPSPKGELRVTMRGKEVANRSSIAVSRDSLRCHLSPGSLKFSSAFVVQTQWSSDRDWTTQDNPTFTIPLTQPGEHKLLARALFADGSHSQVSHFSVTIIPPIWQRPWFWGVMIALFLVILIRELRQLRLKNRLLSLQTEQLTSQVAQETAERLNREAELKMLHSQMNPHFLQNAFNTAIAQLRRAPDNTERMLRNLASLFRHHMQNRPDVWTTLESECQLAKSFLAIQKLRFEERLHYQIECPDALRRARVPSFVIQPLLENAVLHGLDATLEQVIVNLTATCHDDLVVEVANSGCEPLEGVPMASGHALANIAKRLEILQLPDLGYQFRNGMHVFTMRIRSGS